MEEHTRDAFTNRQKTKVNALTSLGDFFNTLKAFIGTNYLALAFAFSQSGLILGIIGVFLIATLTDHCCHLLVKCKYAVIDRLVDEETALRPLSADELVSLRQKLAFSVSYGDVGRLAFGRWCEIVINLTVVFTQFLTCVCYFIFIGNAIFTIYPMVLPWAPENRSILVNSTHDSLLQLRNGIPLLSIENIAGVSDDHHIHRRSVENWDITTWDGFDSYVNYTTEAPVSNTTTPASNMTTPLPTPAWFQRSTAPNLMYIVMFPAPFFLLTSLIRHMRILSPFTVIATLFLFGGAIAVLVFLVIGFTITPHFQWAKYTTLPIFIGQLTSAYEGIGCILPIESSMEGNRHLFPAFLHLAIYIVFFILTAFGVLGYLRYGDNVQQIILLSIPQHSPLAIAVDITLIISVLFTYPLQMFPFIQIVECYIFGPGMCCGGKRSGSDDASLLINDEEGVMERSVDSHFSQSGHEVAIKVPESVPRWKRDILRIILTLITMGTGIAMREAYAYVTAFSGAVGCTLLAFILPCAMHIQLHRNQLKMPFIIKDLIIIFLSAMCSILIIVIIIYKIAKHQVGI